MGSEMCIRDSCSLHPACACTFFSQIADQFLQYTSFGKLYILCNTPHSCISICCFWVSICRVQIAKFWLFSSQSQCLTCSILFESFLKIPVCMGHEGCLNNLHLFILFILQLLLHGFHRFHTCYELSHHRMADNSGPTSGIRSREQSVGAALSLHLAIVE